MSEHPSVHASVFIMDLLFTAASLKAAMRILVPMAAEIRPQRDCLACRVLIDVADRRQVRYQEDWASEVALERRVRSADFRRLLITADLASEEPRVMLGTLHATLGLAYLAQLRGLGADEVSSPRAHE